MGFWYWYTTMVRLIWTFLLVVTLLLGKVPS